MRDGRDTVALLVRALRASAAAAGVGMEVIHAASRPWSSATFSGEQVDLAVKLGEDASTWLGGLSESDLPMRGWFVADLSVSGTTLGALVLRDA